MQTIELLTRLRRDDGSAREDAWHMFDRMLAAGVADERHVSLMCENACRSREERRELLRRAALGPRGAEPARYENVPPGG